MRLATGGADGGEPVGRPRQVVHAEGGGERADHDEGQIDPGEQPRMPGSGGGQYGEADELHDGDPEIAAARVQAQRPALEPLRIERIDVRHR